MGHGGNLELKREAKSKTSFTDQTSAVSHFWIESEDQLGVKDDLMSLIFAQYLQYSNTRGLKFHLYLVVGRPLLIVGSYLCRPLIVG